MLKDLQVTLYEIFGYIMPGAIFTAALAVAFLAIYFPTNHISFDLPTTEVWLTLLALAYFAGHMGQAVANLVVKLVKWDEAKAVQQLPPEIRSQIIERLKTVVGEKAAELSERWQYEVCDDAIIRSGKRGERDLYVYREGFYRGTFVSFALLTIALVMLLIRLFVEEGHTITVREWVISPGQLIFFILISGGWSFLALRRYWRFMDYRVRHSMIGFLTLQANLHEALKPAGEKGQG